MKNRVKRNHWYEGITEAIQMYIPGNKVYRTIQARRARTGTLFILPLIIGFLLFMVRPLYLSFIMSLSKVVVVEGTMSRFNISLNILGKNLIVPFGNYNYAFVSDPDFNKLLVDEIGRMAINTIATLVMSFVIAVILNQNFKGRTVCRSIFFLPVILSSGVLPGIEKQNAYFNLMTSISDAVEKSSGVDLSRSLQNLLSVSGVAQEVFDVIFKMIDSIYDIVMASGIQIIVFLTGLQSISPSLYEAAEVEGCSAWESFWKITFPMVSPLLLVNCIYSIIDFFMKNDNQVIEHINNVTYGMNAMAADIGVASAMSWIYFGVALAFVGISTLIITLAVKSYD